MSSPLLLLALFLVDPRLPARRLWQVALCVVVVLIVIRQLVRRWAGRRQTLAVSSPVGVEEGEPVDGAGRGEP